MFLVKKNQHVPTRKPKYSPFLRIDSQYSLSKGLVGCWLFNEGGGNKVYDLSRNGHHSTLNGPTWVAGKNGLALDFDGSNDYINCGTGFLDGSSDFAVTAWIKTSSSGTEQVIAQQRNGGYFNQYMFLLTTAGKLNMRAYDGGADWDWEAISSQSVNDGVWHFVVGCQLNSLPGGKVYIDGSEDGSDTGDATVQDDTYTTYIGADMRDSALYFNGLIGGVSIYNRALSAEEVAWLYRDPYAFIWQPNLMWLYEEVAAGLSIPIAMHHYKMMRQ